MNGNLKRGGNATTVDAWTAGPDWYRTIVTEPRKQKEAIDAIRTIQQEDFKGGDKLRPWSFQGFRGMASRSVRWGVLDWRLLWESSGEVTPFTMTRLESFTGLGKRLDLQLTLSFSSPLLKFVEQCLRPTTRMTRRQISNGRVRGLSRRTDGYACGTVGRRTHPRYWRVYDKGVEQNSAPVGRKWRLELETKGTLAEDLCKQPLNLLMSPQFCARYLVSSWRSEGYSWPLKDFVEDVDLIGVRKPPPSPAAHLLIWAYRTVSPAAQRLLAAYTVDEVIEAFGLKDVATPRRNENA